MAASYNKNISIKFKQTLNNIYIMAQEVYLAYFDLLGFKEFILNNNDQDINIRMSHFFRDIELSLTQNYTVPHPTRPSILIPDLTKAKLNCVNISDTVLFWTSDTSLESLSEILLISYLFNWKFNLFNFPARGSLMKGTLNHTMGNVNSANNSFYAVQCPYGKVLVDAHMKAEAQMWAGTVIDESVEKDLSNGALQSLLDEHCVKYRVPYKKTAFMPNGDIGYDEYVLRLATGIQNQTALDNTKKDITGVFSGDNKSITDPSVKTKIDNTHEFLEFLKEF